METSALRLGPLVGLCGRCQRLNLSWNTFVGNKDVHNLSDFRLGYLHEIFLESARCPFCRLIFRGVRSNDLGSNTTSIGRDGLDDGGNSVGCYLHAESDSTVSWNSPQNATVRLRVSASKKSSDSTAQFQSFWILPAFRGEAQPLFFGRPMQQKDQRIDLDQARSWIRLCEKSHHPRCSTSRLKLNVLGIENRFRLVDITEMRLIQPVSWNGSVAISYVTLSYVWGGWAGMRNSKIQNSILSLPRGLESCWANLPQSIRDAIQLAEQLGYRYLWVDSLCIVQDDEDDVSANIASMYNIYEGSSLTICAADGRDANAGLAGFVKGRSPGQIEQAISDDLTLTLARSAEFHIEDSQWNTRAWTFQERAASCRCLIFTKNRMIYQCRSSIMREDIVLEDVSTAFRQEHRHSSPLEFPRSPFVSFCLHECGSLYQYQTIASLYSSRHTSKETDIYLAFEGFVQQFRRGLNSTFYHGLPRNCFEDALLWQPFKALQRRHFPLQFGKDSLSCFPSWSWSGWKGHIYHEFDAPVIWIKWFQVFPTHHNHFTSHLLLLQGLPLTN